MPETILAYDSSGNALVATPCEVGAVVDWKRRGMRGSLLCRIEAFKGEKMRLLPLATAWGQKIADAKPVWAQRVALRVLTARQAAERGVQPPGHCHSCGGRIGVYT